MDSPTYISLCTGLGGLDLGLHLALGRDCRPLALVEREAFLASHLVSTMEAGIIPPAPVWSDLKTFHPHSLGDSPDFIIGGYPCQPFSFAGLRRGTDDPRHLWPHIRRILLESEAPFCFFENVPGHLTLGFPEVLADLASLGFNAEWDHFSAHQVGSPQLRSRLFIFGYQPLPPIRRFLDYWLQMGHTLCPRLEGRLSESGPRSSPPQLHSVSSGFPPRRDDSEGWTRWLHLNPGTEPLICGGSHGISPWVDRIRALGNAVLPLVSALALRTLATRALGSGGAG